MNIHLTSCLQNVEQLRNQGFVFEGDPIQEEEKMVVKTEDFQLLERRNSELKTMQLQEKLAWLKMKLEGLRIPFNESWVVL